MLHTLYVEEKQTSRRLICSPVKDKTRHTINLPKLFT